MRFLSLLLLLSLCTCAPPAAKLLKEGPAQSFFLGTYDGEGHDNGIYRFTLQPDGILRNEGRVAEASSPSFLAFNADRSQLVAVEELEKGLVAAYAVEGDKLTLLNRQPSGGKHPCHVAVSNEGYVAVSNYSSGTVEMLKLTGEGLSAPIDVEEHNPKGGKGGAHAHSAYFINNGAEVLSADLGTGELWHYRLYKDSGEIDPMYQPTVAMAQGAGPRHIAFHPNGKWQYAINELNSTITQVSRRKDNVLVAGESWSTLPADYRGDNACADIHVDRAGRFLYGSNRGHNSIVVFEIDQETGALSLVEHESVAGDWPRNFALSPDEKFLLVANQRSGNITTLLRDQGDGELTFVGSTAAPTPVCILF